jgi:chromosome segregation ATPase
MAADRAACRFYIYALQTDITTLRAENGKLNEKLRSASDRQVLALSNLNKHWEDKVQGFMAQERQEYNTILDTAGQEFGLKALEHTSRLEKWQLEADRYQRQLEELKGSLEEKEREVTGLEHVFE